MEKKRKEIITEGEPTYKTIKRNSLEFDHSYCNLPKLPLGIKCLICDREVPSSSESETHILRDQVSTVRLLGQLCKILKLSPEVCRRLLEKSPSTVAVLFCDSCEQNVSSCLKIAQEIDHLQNVWDGISDQIKRNIIKDHRCRLESSGNAFIRKTLVQCWTKCSVQIKPLQLLPTNKSKNQVHVDILITDQDHPQLQPIPVAEIKREESSGDVITVTAVNNILTDPTVEYAPDTDFQFEDDQNIICHDDNDDDEYGSCVVAKSQLPKKLTIEQNLLKKPALSKTPHKRKPRRNLQIRIAPRHGALKIRSRHRLEEFPYSCSICGKGYHRSKNLKIHEEAHENVQEFSNGSFPFTCPTCNDLGFKSATSLSRHNAVCHKTSSIPDSGTDANGDGGPCEVVFVKEAKPKRPLLWFECTYCKKMYNADDYRVEEGSSKLRIKCDQIDCDKTFSHFATFSYHHDRTCPVKTEQLSHPRPSSTEQGKRKRVIIRHYYQPSTEEGYSGKNTCRFCGKSFSTPHNLRDHEICIHTKDFKFCCEICGSPCASRSKLNTHLKFHGERQFMCERCPKTFTTRYQLKNHRNTHENIRPFVCDLDLCGKAYCSNNALWMHKKQCHKK